MRPARGRRNAPMATPIEHLESWRRRYAGREYTLEQDGQVWTVSLFRPAARRLVIRRHSDPHRAVFAALKQALRSGL